MNNLSKLLVACAITALCGWALQSMADIVIDNFNQGSVDILVNNGSQTASDTDGGLSTTNVIGGERYSFLQWQTGTDNTTLKINTSGDDLEKASYGSQPGNDGYYYLIYGNGSALNADLTQGGTNNRFGLRFLFSDVVGTTTVSIVTDGVGTSTLSHANPLGGTMDEWVYFDYSDFSGSADFDDVDKITLTINGTTGADITLDHFSTTFIPEPTTLALMGMVGTVIVLLRRNRRT